MDSLLQKLPKALASYLSELITDEGFSPEDKKGRRFLQGWLKKRVLFDKIVEHNDFELVNKIGADYAGGILLLTYSGSLITVSAEHRGGTRDLKYEGLKHRKEQSPYLEEKEITIDFPIRLNESVILNGSRLVKTSPIFSMAIATPLSAPKEEKQFKIIGERISQALSSINEALFGKTTEESALEEREDLFHKWVLLKWFHIGGWEEEVFLVRARILWLELFSHVYNQMADRFLDKNSLDFRFLEVTNQKFPKYCDIFKWLESEKANNDIGLMKALEKIPETPEYKKFMTQTVNSY